MNVTSCDLPVEKNENRSVNTHIKTTRMKKRRGKGKRKRGKEVRSFHTIYVYVKTSKEVSYKGRTDSAIESMQAPPASILFPV